VILLGLVCFLGGMGSGIVPEWLWRKTQAARVLQSYPRRARMAARRAWSARADDRVPMVLLKATRVRMGFELRLWPVRLVSAGLYLAGSDLLIASNAGDAHGPHPAVPLMGVALVQAMCTLAMGVIAWMLVSRRRDQLERVIELRERAR